MTESGRTERKEKFRNSHSVLNRTQGKQKKGEKEKILMALRTMKDAY